ncbi:ATP-binding protein [Streptacidiphilus sp. MAP5-3]|uniref:ATP-binding protein n=1 Tax=unclassified Streptacidiphilus TaxID=2643834 RepID=UPI003510E6F7
MSLPLSRRIVQAALVVAAGAAPVIAAGAAQAAPALPTVPDLGGVSSLDTAGLGSQLQSATHQTGELAGTGAGRAVSDGVPVVADAAGSTAGQAVPIANRSLGESALQVVGLAGQAVTATHGTGALTGTRAMPAAATDGTAAAPAGAPLSAPIQAPAAAPAPASGPLGALPLQSLPVNTPLTAAQGALGGVTREAPAQRLGSLPGLGGAANSPLSTVTNVLPGVGGLPLG